MIFYFSGTGNTRWIAQQLAEATGEELRFIPDEMKKDVMRYNFVKEKTNFFDVKAGQFVIFFPTDWHIAKLNNKKKNDSQQIRVIVVKMDYKD